MKAKNKKANFIIILIIGLLMILVGVIQMLLIELQRVDEKENANVIVKEKTLAKATTIKEIIENSGSKYINRTKNVFEKIYVNFKYDLYDENGKSQKTYFYDIIEQIVELTKDSFYLMDEEKNIEIYVQYNSENETYKVTINQLDDFYSETDGDIYIKLEKAEIVHQNAFGITNRIYSVLQLKGMYYANSVIVTAEREQLQNGYYTYPTEHIKAKLGGGKVLNLILDKEFEGEIAPNVTVTTKLEDVEKKYPNPGFGSYKEGFLGYRTINDYVFLYEDEASIYSYKYQENEYFDKYLSDYCLTGNLDKLVSDFTTEWSSYFEFDYDAEKQNLKLVFPTRGLSIDIKENDSRGITVYSNYYLTETVKELIKKNKISIEPEKDLILITEQKRRESMN